MTAQQIQPLLVWERKRLIMKMSVAVTMTKHMTEETGPYVGSPFGASRLLSKEVMVAGMDLAHGGRSTRLLQVSWW